MAKRDPQVFEWSCKNGVLKIMGRKDSGFDSTVKTYLLSDYPAEIRQNIADAGFKAVFQQRTSQVEADALKLGAWDDLNDLFVDGEWEREGGARGAPIVGAWVEALAAAKSCSVGELQATLNGLTKEVRATVRKNAELKLATEIAAIKAARIETKQEAAIDLTDLS